MGRFLGMAFLTEEREVKEESLLLLPPFLQLRMLSWKAVMWSLAAILCPSGGYREHVEGGRAEKSAKSPVTDQPWSHTLPEFLLFEKNHLKSLSV